MAKLIKSELYRFTKFKCTYIMLIITACYSIITPALLRISINYSLEDSGISCAEFMHIYLSSSSLIMFMVIFTVIFVGSEIKSGYLKSILTDTGKRRKIALANIAVSEVMILAIFLVSFAVTIISNLLFFDDVKFGFDGDFWVFALGEFLLYSAFAALIIFFTYLLRSNAFSMAFGICGCAGIMTLLLTLISFIIKYSFDISDEFSLSKYTLVYNITNLSPDATGSDLYLPFIVGAVAFVLFTFLSCLVIEKRDIK